MRISYKDKPNSSPNNWPIITQPHNVMFAQGRNQTVSTNPDMEKLKILQDAGYRFLCDEKYARECYMELHRPTEWRTPDGLFYTPMYGMVAEYLDRQIEAAWKYYQALDVNDSIAVTWQDWME